MKLVDLEPIRQQLQEKIEIEFEKQLRKIPESVEKIVTSAIASIIGVKRSGNSFAVDSWNRRSESINAYIENKTNKKIQEIVGPIVDAEFKKLLKLKTFRTSISERCHSEIANKFESSFRENIKSRVEELGKRVSDKMADDFSKALENPDFITDLENPDSFKGRIGNLLLEEIAKNLAED